jgi:hypothetical protein
MKTIAVLILAACACGGAPGASRMGVTKDGGACALPYVGQVIDITSVNEAGVLTYESKTTYGDVCAADAGLQHNCVPFDGVLCCCQ